MRKNILIPSFLLFMLVNVAYGQQDRFAYVITDITKEGASWNSLRKLDLQSNSYSDVLLNGNDLAVLHFDAASKKQFTSPLNDERFGTVANAAFGTGVAAIAYDKKNNRLFYTPMFIDQLRYIDLKTMKVYFVTGLENEALKVKAQDQSNIITRMAIASDGNGYALTNDGTHLIQFTTGKKTTMTDLGALVDDAANKNVSIRNAGSFGGDMIADDDDNLFVFSARQQVFKINITTKTATYLGAISGLPENFSVNAVVVGTENRILIASATNNNALYTVDHETWIATGIQSPATPWRSSDMANSNLLATRKSKPIPTVLTAVLAESDRRIQLYPNPVIANKFTVQFTQPHGRYTILVTDALGRQRIRSVVSVQGMGQVQDIRLPATTKKGVYIVKVVDQESKTLFSRKIVVQ